MLASPAIPVPAVDGDGIPLSLDGLRGDPARGRTLIVARDPANCVLCHVVPKDVSSVAGDVGPSLVGIAQRMSEAELRLRIVDMARVNADTVMPPYYRVDGLSQVAAPYRDKTILSAQQVEDIVAWLATLH